MEAYLWYGTTNCWMLFCLFGCQIHGILNVVSWGILFPVGAIIARYLRTFESADPAWFYLHAFCQVSAYAIGVAGWATGLKLGGQSQGIIYTDHRNIGIALFCLATVQVMFFRKLIVVFRNQALFFMYLLLSCN